MPETTTERLAALVGVLAALLLLLVAFTANSRGDPVPVAASAGPGTSTEVATPSAAQTAPSPVAPRPKTTPKSAANTPLLILTAARGDCWLSARSGSADGRILYEGTLLSGRSLRLNGARLWVRFGAAANIDLTLNGKKIAALPAGTGDVVATATGIQPAV